MHVWWFRQTTEVTAPILIYSNFYAPSFPIELLQCGWRACIKQTLICSLWHYIVILSLGWNSVCLFLLFVGSFSDLRILSEEIRQCHIIDLLPNDKEGIKKHRKNCECRPVSVFIVMNWGFNVHKIRSIMTTKLCKVSNFKKW